MADVRLYKVDLKFGVESVAGILNTGTQQSLLSTLSYDCIQAQVPPLLVPPSWAQGLIGASGESLTVRGELMRCPVTLNGYKYHTNLVVADLGAVDIILGMDFLKAYGAVIDLKADKVSLQL